MDVDLRDGSLLSGPRDLWSGTGLRFPRAPHLYHRGDHGYLMIAEGGTGRGHGVSIARADNSRGPFVPTPANPSLSARSTDRPIQNTGHGDLVDLADGRTLMVLLGVRPRGGTQALSAFGRETFVTEVRWGDGWPVADPVELRPRDGDVALARVDGRYLSAETAASFTGRVLGVFARGTVTFDALRYTGSER